MWTGRLLSSRSVRVAALTVAAVWSVSWRLPALYGDDCAGRARPENRGLLGEGLWDALQGRFFYLDPEGLSVGTACKGEEMSRGPEGRMGKPGWVDSFQRNSKYLVRGGDWFIYMNNYFTDPHMAKWVNGKEHAGVTKASDKGRRTAGSDWTWRWSWKAWMSRLRNWRCWERNLSAQPKVGCVGNAQSGAGNLQTKWGVPLKTREASFLKAQTGGGHTVQRCHSRRRGPSIRMLNLL